MKNDVLTHQSSREGIYEEFEIVNGKKSWKKSTDAIWFDPSHNSWIVGNLQSIGSTLGGIKSFCGTGSSYENPYSVPSNKWQYCEYGVLKRPADSADIIINAIKGK